MLHLSAILRRNLVQMSRAFSTGGVANKSVAVVLSGSGVYDGSEIHEASAVLVHLSRAGADVSIYAPDIPQMHVINHLKGEEMKEERNVLLESARIARGKIAPLAELSSSSHDAVVFPGGFGAAKNLSTFAVEGTSFKVNDQVEKVIKDFHGAQKPIGLCCIAPVLAAKVISGCAVTVGQSEEGNDMWPYAGTAASVEQMGAKHVNKNVDEVHIDEQNKVVTTPAYMCETKVHEVHDGIGKMVTALVEMI